MIYLPANARYAYNTFYKKRIFLRHDTIRENQIFTVSCRYGASGCCSCRRCCLLLLRFREMLLAFLQSLGLELLLEPQHGFWLSLVRHAERLQNSNRKGGGDVVLT